MGESLKPPQPQQHTPKTKTLTEAQKLHLGVLGDGQLAQMMAQEAQKMGLNFSVLSPDSKSPAAQVTSRVTLGSADKLTDFLDFCKNKDLVTIESEFIDPQTLEQSSCPVWPKPETLKSLRDRLPQKKSFIDHNIPTSPLYLFSGWDEVEKALKPNSLGLVFKKRLFGYDGYGTRIIKNLSDLEKFKSENPDLNEWIAEDLIDFKVELAISFARNASNQILEFPLVQSHQEQSKCLWVQGPLEKTPHQDFINGLKNYIQALDFIGLISFELFLTQDHKLLVNEVAPRVHNSAHYSLEALPTNQFKAHLMAICNMDLPTDESPQKPFAMYNLIGESQGPTSNLSLPADQQNVFLHWYHKTETRPGRKMGHLTALADTSEEALLRLKNARKEFQL